MRKKTTRRIRQSIVAGVVGVACIFGCENLEVAFAETATVTDATAEDATAGENGDDTDIESAETMFVGDTGVQADATGTDATEMDAYDETLMGVLLSVAKGTSTITESVWDNRFRYVDELRKMGASVQVDGQVAVFEGVEKLSPAPLRASDLRAGAAMVVAALMADGTSEIEEIGHIERGYENIVEKLRGLGADISKVERMPAALEQAL